MTYREPMGNDTYVHVCNRGTKGLSICREEGDLWRLMANLFYLNHQRPMPENWVRKLNQLGLWTPGVYSWPEEWGVREPIVSILAFCLMPNHLHLILKARVKRGIPKFMHRISMAYSKFINEKYTESGALFQGAYKSRLVQTDEYLRYLAVYVLVKNPFELNPRGLRHAIEHFDDAFERALSYPFVSLGSHVGKEVSPIIEKDIYGEIFELPGAFKEFEVARGTLATLISCTARTLQFQQI